MKVILQSIHSDDPRTTPELRHDEVVESRVAIEVDGRPRAFIAFVRANVLPQLDASIVYGDSLLEELLRFEPEALNMLYAMVGKHRRGTSLALPLVLVDTDSASEAQLGATRM